MLDDIQFSKPEQIFTKRGPKYMRYWELPEEKIIQEGFWEFWKANKLKMMGKGFSIFKDKKTKRWRLQEWKDRIQDFPEYKNEPDIELVSELTPKPLKNSNGLRSWQIEATEYLVASLKKHNAAIDGSDTGTGKCHPKGTLIKMFNGKDIPVENIKCGDLLMGDDSTPRQVIKTSTGFGKLFDIIPTSGDVWGCNEDHILVLWNTRTKTISEITVRDCIKRLNESARFRHEQKLVRVGVKYDEVDIGIDSYFVGLWLGDGTWCRPGITINDHDIETISYVKNFASSYDMIVNENGKSNKTYIITNGNVGGKKNEVLESLRKLGLTKTKDKFIPDCIKYNSDDIRKRCLSGLIDSDGYKQCNGGYQIASKHEKLIDDIIEVARSLGFFARKTGGELKDYTIGKYSFKSRYWGCYIKGAYELPIKLPRKQSCVDTSNKSCLVSSFKIEPRGEGEYFGFTIDGNNRYLLHDFTITHNTYTAVAAARELGYNVAVVCPKAVIESWRRVIKDHFGIPILFVWNYEAIKGGKYSEILELRKKDRSNLTEYVWHLPKKTLLIFDESHRLKGRNTKNSEMAAAAKEQGIPILCCSATNAINPLELNAVGNVLGLHKGGQSFYQWAYKHGCQKGRFGIEFQGGKQILKKLHKDIFLDRGVRLRKDDIPDFPESDIVAEPYSLDTTSEAKINKIYFDMNKELAALDKKTSKDKRGMALTIRLRARQRIELLKVPLFIEMTEDLIADGQSVVIMVNFTDTIKALSKKLGTKCIIWGENKGTERQDAIDNFQADKERIMILNIQAGGVGVSLHDLNGNYPRTALISPNDSAPLLRQAFGRIHRAGAKTKSQQRVVFVANTVEEEVCNNVKMKLHNLDLINDGDLAPKDATVLKE